MHPSQADLPPDHGVATLIMMLMVLLSLAFLTLLERKFLGYIQIRKGPNKILFKGVFQPFSDALKLLSKEFFWIKNLNYIFYVISPIMSMGLMLMMWLIMPIFFNMYYLDLNILLFFCFLSMGVYMMMMSGWASNSIYSMLGSIRSVAQSISYEVSLILIILSNLMLVESFSLMSLIFYQEFIYMFLFMYPIMLMFMISLVAELNRTPFDLSEGESELVSGFNIEYMSGGGFVLIFMSEYGAIMLMSLIMVIFYYGGLINELLFYLKVLMMMILIIVFRGSFPRVRYDKLMMLIWKKFLSIILNLLMYLYFIKWLIIFIY